MAQSRRNAIVVLAVALLAVAAIIFALMTALNSPRQRTRYVTTAPASAPISTAARPTTTFSNGIVAQLLAVRDYDNPNTWWGADGLPVPPPAYVSTARMTSNPNSRLIQVVYHAEATHIRDMDFRERLGVNANGGTSRYWLGEREVIFGGTFAVPRDVSTTTVDFGLAAGPWQTFDSLTREAAATRPVPATKPYDLPPESFGNTRIRTMFEQDGRTRAAYVYIRNLPERDTHAWRAVAFDTRGQLHRWTDVDYKTGDMVFIFNLPLKNVARAEYQIRPVEWKTAGTISLKPVSPSPPPSGTSAHPELHFDNNIVWRLEGIREYPNGQFWWDNDGSPVSVPAGQPPTVSTKDNRVRYLELRHRTTSATLENLPQFLRILHLESEGGRYTPIDPTTVAGSVILAVPKNAPTGQLKVAVVASAIEATQPTSRPQWHVLPSLRYRPRAGATTSAQRAK
jgi:hypothetical protein